MLEVRDLGVVLGEVPIIRHLDLRIEDGESVALLGPSGSGKSTLLRAIAGIVPLSEGDVRWDGESIKEVPTHLRDFGLMFQGYALFPHLTVAGNVGFGLRMKGMSRERVAAAVEEALARVGLAGFGPRTIADLSGGEQQRVALARTLAPQPRLVMLDEPLGALDRALRERLLVEMRRILDDGEVTTLVVTHDHEEATALSDRLALMNQGTVVQTGTKDELLASPADPWVADFLG